MFCSKCGKEIPEGDKKICDECQQKLLEELEKEEEEAIIENSEEEKDKKKKNKKQDKKEKEEKQEKENKEDNEDSKPIKKCLKIVDKIIICICVLFLIITIILSSVYIFYRNQEIGNTIGNIRNYGYSAIQGDWIYCLIPNEDNTKNGIYKIKNNGEEKQELIMLEDISVVAINVYKDHIYFIGINENGYDDNNQLDNKIYKMKLDGSNLEIINDNEISDNSYEIYVVKNKIYYIGVNGEIARMNLDGTDKTTVIDNELGFLGITQKYIIYDIIKTNDSEENNEEIQDTNTVENTVENTAASLETSENTNTVTTETQNTDTSDGTDDQVVSDKEYITYISNLDGTNPRPIINDKKIYSVNIYDDYVYYTDADRKIYKTKIDSNVEELVYDMNVYNFNTNGEYAYYLLQDEETNVVSIYRSKLDGTSETPELIKNLDEETKFINVLGDWVFYMDSNGEAGFINLVSVDGTDKIVQLYYLNYKDYYENVLLKQNESSESEDNTTSTETDQAQDVENTEQVQNTESTNQTQNTETVN